MAEKKRKSLAQFIDDNHKLISALGIFTALTVFSTSIQPKAIGYLLSFSFLACTFLLWIELWLRCPNSSSSELRLQIFENVAYVIIFAVGLYWVLEFREVWRYFMILPIWFTFAYFLLWVLTKLNIVRDLNEQDRGWRKYAKSALLLCLFAVVFFGSFYIAGAVSRPLNAGLDEIQMYIDNIEKNVKQSTNNK